MHMTIWLLILLLWASPISAQMQKGIGSAPSVSACGTSPSVSGTDNWGVITVGTGVVTSCLLSFSQTYGAAPVCIMTPSAATVAVGLSISTSAATIALSATLAGGKIFYWCGAP